MTHVQNQCTSILTSALMPPPGAFFASAARATIWNVYVLALAPSVTTDPSSRGESNFPRESAPSSSIYLIHFHRAWRLPFSLTHFQIFHIVTVANPCKVNVSTLTGAQIFFGMLSSCTAVVPSLRLKRTALQKICIGAIGCLMIGSIYMFSHFLVFFFFFAHSI